MRRISMVGRGQRGQILVLLLIVLAITVLTIPSILSITSATHRSTDVSNEETQQFYAADSGIEHALSMIGNQTWLNDWLATGESYNSENFVVNGYDVTYTIEKVEGTETLDIEATATISEDSGNGVEGVDNTRVIRSQVPYRTLTIEVNPPEGGITTPLAGNYTYPKGIGVPLSTTCNELYEFQNWTGPVDNPVSQSTSITMNDDCTVTANFLPEGDECWLEMMVDPPGSGTTTPTVGGLHWYNQDDVVNISALASPGYSFGYWHGNTATVGNVLSPDTTVTMQGNYTIYAYFKRIYSLTVSSTAGGTASVPIKGAYNFVGPEVFTFEGVTNDVQLVATSYGGYHFVKWTGNATIDDPYSDIIYVDIDGDYTVQAIFGKDLVYPCMKFAIASVGEGEDLNVTKPPVRVDYAVDGDIYVKGDVTIAQVTTVRGNVYAEGNIILEKGAEVSGSAHGYGNVYLQEGAIVDGNVYAGDSSVVGNIVVDRNGIIRCDAYARGSITLNCQGGRCGQVLGTKHPNYSPMPEFPPTYEPDWEQIRDDYKADAESVGNHTGDYSVSNDEVVSLGPLHITGNLDIGNGASVTLAGTVYVDGQVYLNPGCVLMGPGFLLAEQDIQIWTNNDIPGNSLPVIMSVYGNIDCKNTSELRAVLYAPHGTVTLWNVTSVYGAVMGYNIDPRNNFSVDYADELLGMMDCP